MCPYKLDFACMNRALPSLAGTHDFAAFAASGTTTKTTVRTLYEARLALLGQWLIMDVLGDGFLYNMVRIIAGTLIDIGRGKCDTDAFAKMIQSGDRQHGGVTAPPQGLMLMHVFYDSDGEIQKKWTQMMMDTPF